MYKLKYKEIKEYREQFLKEQNGKCLLCGQQIEPGKEVLDHDHRSGQIRGVLHRGCNALLGKIENSMAMNGIDDWLLSNICHRLISYRIHKKELLHPTYKTIEEKKLKQKLKNKKKTK